MRYFLVLLTIIVTLIAPALSGQADYEVAIVMQRWLHRTGDYRTQPDGKCSISLLEAFNRHDVREKDNEILNPNVGLDALCEDLVGIYMIVRSLRIRELEESNYGFDIVSRDEVERIQTECRWPATTLIADADFFSGALRSAVIRTLQSFISEEIDVEDYKQIGAYHCMLKIIS